jgi:hypothetical protein
MSDIDAVATDRTDPERPLGPPVADATDPTRSVTVSIDAHNRLVGVVVNRADGVRTPAELATALSTAHRIAVVETYAAATSRTPGAARPVARTSFRRPVHRPELLDRHEVRPQAHAEGRRARPVGTVTGTSDNECVWVELGVAQPVGVCGAEPGWLANAAAHHIASAVVQAFRQAYQERTVR